ncbi:acyltransferase [Mucilaginibacter sp.]|jgi:acetyltransferase-like isoleucine patch superfamily enzyme|uniref:acyltransferase n=1 Tax=Mucilaginibacter sp. TaxID=1882438 RepID=UPI002C1D1740|nr:acyltransferase [Mucilaginibacter sp.]HTI61592.1 acyltransferase [Mucilaginibacter sp.]
MKTHVYIYKQLKKIYIISYLKWVKIPVWFKLKVNDVQVGKGLRSNGVPVIDVWDTGKFSIGENFLMNNGKRFNVIGRQQPCYFIVYNNAVLEIGNNVGISGSAFICFKGISIGNNVRIGGNVAVYDTDFHSLNKYHRRDGKLDIANTQSRKVIIEDDVFIGAHSTILKGVTIGEGAIIGAGSVVAKSVPKNEIWAGNPAKFIKSVTY